MSARAWMLAAALAVVGCGGGSGTFVSVTIDRLGSGTDVASIDLALDLDGVPASATLREPGGGAISLPTSATLAIGKGAGTLSITAVARDAAGVELARDSASTLVTAGKKSTLTLSLRMSDSGDDMAVPADMTAIVPADLAGADMTTIAPPDMAMADMTLAADMTMAVVHDLAMPHDLSMVTPPDLATTATAPSAPRSVSAAAGDTAATVSWLAPTSNGGSPITQYTVTASPGSLTTTTNGSTLNTTFTGLTNGTTYVFSVTATNGAGTGAASSPSNTVVPAGVPLAPTGVGAVVTAPGTLSVSWTAAGANGSAVQGYVITPGSGTAKSATASPVSFTGLTVGTSYTFTVTAHNAIGTGAASSPSASVAAADVPSQPQMIIATYQSDGTVLIAWQTPNSNFSPILDYTIGTANVSGTFTTTSNPYTRSSSGMTNGQKYTFYVTPRNAAGSGPLGSSTEITYGAPTPPATPTNFAVSGTHFAVCYSFTPSVGATSYNIYYSTLASKVFTSTPVSTTNPDSYVSGLSADTPYYLAVTAVNAQGESPATAVLSATPDGGILQPSCAQQSFR